MFYAFNNDYYLYLNIKYIIISNIDINPLSSTDSAHTPRYINVLSGGLDYVRQA